MATKEALKTTSGDSATLLAQENQDGSTSKGPQFRIFPGLVSGPLDKMTDNDEMRNSQTYLADVAYSRVPGKELTSGCFRMMSGPALQYRYTYEEMKFIAEGVFHLTDGTGQTAVVRAGDLVYFPKGCNVTFKTPHYAAGVFTGQRKEGEVLGDEDSLGNPKFVVFPQIIFKNLDKMDDGDSQKNSNTYFGDMAFSEVAGKELATGVFRMLSGGPPLEYTYTYEEMKFIAEGVFHLTDGTGQKGVAKAGDLVYFPKGCQVQFQTPHYAAGVFTGQRKNGEQ